MLSNWIEQLEMSWISMQIYNHAPGHEHKAINSLLRHGWMLRDYLATRTSGWGQLPIGLQSMLKKKSMQIDYLFSCLGQIWIEVKTSIWLEFNFWCIFNEIRNNNITVIEFGSKYLYCVSFCQCFSWKPNCGMYKWHM